MVSKRVEVTSMAKLTMEAEMRAILDEWLASRVSERGTGSRIHERFAGLDAELPVPRRDDEPTRAAVLDP
jgi:antitoxin FitA